MGLIQKAFGDIITFSRASNATRVGPTGLVEYAPHNLLQRSEEFDNGSWTKTGGSVTPNSITAPDGSVTADLFVEDSSLTPHRVSQNASITSGIAYTLSVFAKAGSRTFLQLFFNSTEFGAQAFANFDLSTGVAGTIGSSTVATITSAGGGWYRCSISATATATGASSASLIQLITSSTAARNQNYTGDGTSGLYLWGAQLSVGPYALDYTPTTTAAVYGPRFDFDPVTRAAKGLLIEEQRTNLLTYSEDFSNAAWSIINSTITSNTIVAPNGTVTGDKFVEGSNSSTKELYRSYSASALTYTLSFYAKSDGTRNVIRASIATASLALGGGTYFNVGNGTNTGATNYGATTGTVVGMSSVGNGWYKCFVTVTATAATYYVDFMLANDSNNLNYTGNGFSGVYIWGAQLEAGAFATSYIPTVASTVTRSADVASVNTLSPWYSATEGTLFTDADLTVSAYVVQVGGASQVGLNPGSFTFTTPFRIAATYKLNDFAASQNGATVVTDTSGTIPTVTTLFLGYQGGGGGVLNGHLRRIAYYPRRLTNAELQALSA
jgi:hypothetical protein